MASFGMYRDQAGEWRWSMWAGNNKKIADSGEGYRNKTDCRHGIHLVKRDAPSAKVYEKDTNGNWQEVVR